MFKKTSIIIGIILAIFISSEIVSAAYQFNPYTRKRDRTLLNENATLKDIFPLLDSTYVFGSSTKRWLGGYFDNLFTTNITIDGITGSTQCLTVDTNGLVSGTGSACGAGGGGGTGGGEWQYIGDNLQNKTTTSTDVGVVGTFQASSTGMFGTDVIIYGNLVNIGFGQFNNVTTTDSLYVGGNAWIEGTASTSNLFTHYIDANIEMPAPDHNEGRLHWEDDDKTWTIDTEVTGTSLQIGQEQFLRVTNKTGSQIDDGKVVYINGAIGNRPTIALALADAHDTAQIIGVTTQDIADDGTGYVTIFGLVRDIDTSDWANGDAVYLSATTSGAFVNYQAQAPNHPALVGYIANSHANEGILVVNTDEGNEISELHDVNGGLPTQDQYLAWNDGSSYYTPSSTANLTIGSFVDLFAGNASTTNSLYVGGTLWNGTKNLTDYAGFYNGTFKEAFNALVKSDGTTASTTVQSTTGGDITVRFSSGDTILDCSDISNCTIEITAGDDDDPQKNYIYILESAPSVLVVDTTEFPATEHAKIAFLFCPSLAEIQGEGGCYINQNWNDFATNGSGMGGWARSGEQFRYGKGYFSGLDPNGTDQAPVGSYFNYISGSESYYKSTAGVMYQKNRHNMPAIDTSGSDDIHIVNSSIAAYNEISDFTDIVLDADGDPLDNSYWNICIFEIGNKTSQYAPVMAMLPSGSYVTESGAVNDTSGFDNCGLPREFIHDSGTGVPIVRLTLRYTGGTNTLTHISSRDLRDEGATGGGSGVGVTTYLGLTDTPTDRSGLANWLVAVSAGETADEYVNDITINSATTTGHIFAGSYASSTIGFFSQGDLHIGGNATIDGTLDVLGAVTGSNLNISNWDTAFGWGDHSVAGYLLQSEWEATTTDALAEGSSNLYYTQERTWSDMRASSTLAYWNLNGSDAYYEDGNVGIGTADPRTKTEIDATSDTGILTLTNDNMDNSGTNNNYRALFESTAALELRLSGEGSNGDWSFFFENPNAGNMNVMIDGDVGIGTVSPSMKFEVEDGAVGGTTMMNLNNQGAGQFIRMGIIGNIGQIAVDDGDSLQFGTATSKTAPLVPLMTMLREGYVGIGVTNPTGILHVDGGTAAAEANGTDINITAQSGGTFSGDSTLGGDINITSGDSPADFGLSGDLNFFTPNAFATGGMNWTIGDAGSSTVGDFIFDGGDGATDDFDSDFIITNADFILGEDDSIASSTLMLGNTESTNAGCLVIEDTDSAGFTYCTALNGTLTCNQVDCT